MKWINKMMFLSIAVAMFSCSSDDDIDTTSDPIVDDPTPDPIEETIGKKGVAYTGTSPRWSHRTNEMKAHWMYSWGSNLRDEVPENVEFVPMIWGRGAANNDEVIDRLKQLKEEGKIKYLLGFNEPDGASQANMTVEEAIELWPRLEEVGVPLGSPATINPNNQWMKDFMQQADALGLRVDFITVHHYGGTSVPNLINKLRTTYQDYGERPIWITEFAVADWNATTPSANTHSEEEVIQFMNELFPALEQIDYVERYAWFDTRQNMPQLYTSSLYDKDNNITPVGNVYANFAPNMQIGPGQDTEFIPPVDDGQLLINGGFESAQVQPWGGFKNGVVGPAANPLTGNFAARIEFNDGSLFYELSLEPGETYELIYNTRWSDTPGSTIRGGIRNQTTDEVLFNTDELSTSTEWQEGRFTFTIPESVSSDDTIRIVFYKPQRDPSLPALFFDDMSLKVKED
jgi:hypothetical protein